MAVKVYLSFPYSWNLLNPNNPANPVTNKNRRPGSGTDDDLMSRVLEK